MDVYLLRPGTSGFLQQLGVPETSTTTVTPDLNNFQFRAPRPGVYAIVLTVYDVANNSARARKIFNYNDQPGFEDTQTPVRFLSSNSSSFITALDDDTPLILSWAGRFVPKNEELSQRVEPWPIDQNTIDDVYGTTFGLRSISAVSGAVGVSGMTCVYRIVSNSNASDIPDQPDLDADALETGTIGNCTTDLQNETATLDIASLISNGDTVFVWLNVTDYTDKTAATVRVKAIVDNSRPDVIDHTFVANRDDEYNS